VGRRWRRMRMVAPPSRMSDRPLGRGCLRLFGQWKMRYHREGLGV